MIMKKLMVAFLFSLFAMSVQAETPQQASQAILKLLKANDFETLFRTRYTELHKAKTPEEEKKVIEVLSGYWKKDIKMIVSVFEQLSGAEFKISKHEHAQKTETGRKAEAPVKIGDKEGKYQLYEMKSGLWGFHM